MNESKRKTAVPQLSPQDGQACIHFLRDLIRLPSLSGQENAVADRVEQELRLVGFDHVYRDRIGNVIGRMGSGQGLRLLFNGHMDVVGPGNRDAWRRDPFGAELENGVIYGRGAADMKAGLAAMIYGAKLAAESRSPLRGELILAAVVQEEPCEGVAMQVLVEEEGLWPSFVVLGEPTNLDVAVGHRGRVELRVVTTGKACHSSAPELGENALYAAAKVIFGIELLASQLATDPALGRGSIAVTGIDVSAGSRNVVPDRCELIVDRRLTLGETRERALSEIYQILDREGVSGTATVAEYELRSYNGYTRRGQDYYPPWLMTDDSPLVKSVVRAVEKARGVRPRLKAWPFSTDGSYTRGVAGIPTVGFGPGDERHAHTVDEQVPIADVLTAAAGYAHIVDEILRRR